MSLINKTIKHNFNTGDDVTVCIDDIDSSNDAEFLESLYGKKLTIVKLDVFAEAIIHYTCVDENGNTIFFKNDVPFGFIDVDLKIYE